MCECFGFAVLFGNIAEMSVAELILFTSMGISKYLVQFISAILRVGNNTLKTKEENSCMKFIQELILFEVFLPLNYLLS